MSRYYDYDPTTGLHEIQDWDGERVTVHQYEDVEPLIEQNKRAVQLGLADSGIKKGMFLYARIPMTVVLEMKKKGLDVFDKNVSARRLEQEINQNYPYLKVTSKNAN